MKRAEVLPGKPYPLGATYLGNGVNFAVFSEHARKMEVCLFDPREPSRELRRYVLPEQTQHVWHGFVPGLQTGTLYGLRAHGAYEPRRGLRFNPHKLLVDPYARALYGQVDFSAPVYAYVLGDEEEDLSFDTRDSAPGVPKAVVLTGRLRLGGGQRPARALEPDAPLRGPREGPHEAAPGVPEHLRGTYAGLAHPAVIEHLKQLGVTAVELLPIHDRVDEPFLVNKGLTNYWGYNTLGYFAPDARFSASGALGGAGGRVQGDGEGPAPRRHRGHPRRRLQPHLRGQPPAGPRCPSRAWTTPPTTGCRRRTRATTWTSPGAATR